MKLFKKVFLTGIIGATISQGAQAVPLFGESAGTIKNGVLTLYKDHHDPKKVYFFPNSTKFSVDNRGVPMFNFVYWGLNNPNATDKGAFLTMSTHLASDKEQQAALNSYLQQHPEMEVAVLPIKSSVIGLTSTDKNSTPLSALFTEYNFAKAGGRAEDEIGVNAVLTASGARAFKAVLGKESGGQLLKMDYCYVVQGFGPSMNAMISINMKRVYEYFEANHSGGWGWFSWQIHAVTEKLFAEKSIVISKHGGDAKDWEYLIKISEAITARLFTPELSSTPSSPVAGGNRLFRFGVSSVKKEELQSENWVWNRTDLEDREYCTSIAIKDLEPYRNLVITDADAN